MAGRITAWRLRPWPAASAPPDYSAVVIPLEQAHLHSHSARCGRTTEYDEVPGAAADDPEDGGGKGAGDDAGEMETMLEIDAAEYSISGLRNEVRRGERREGGKGTAGVYESEFVAVCSCPGGWEGCFG